MSCSSLQVNGLSLSNDGLLLASCGNDKKVTIWSFPAGSQLKQFHLDGWVSVGHLCPLVASLLAAFPPSHWLPSNAARSYLCELHCSASNETARGDAPLLASVRGSHLLSTYRSPMQVRSAIFSPDNSMLAAAGATTAIHVWRRPPDFDKANELVHDGTVRHPTIHITTVWNIRSIVGRTRCLPYLLDWQIGAPAILMAYHKMMPFVGEYTLIFCG